MFSNFFGNSDGSGVTITSGNSGTSFIQCGRNGQTVVINGQAYDAVTRVVLETTQRQRVAVPGEFERLELRVQGDCERIDCKAGEVIVEGDCLGSVKTMSGSVSVARSCKGDVGTMSGAVDVAGNVRGSVRTMSGAIRHSMQRVLKVERKKKRTPLKPLVVDDDDDTVEEEPAKKRGAETRDAVPETPVKRAKREK